MWGILSQDERRGQGILRQEGMKFLIWNFVKKARADQASVVSADTSSLTRIFL
jgi:hypothetical protein